MGLTCATGAEKRLRENNGGALERQRCEAVKERKNPRDSVRSTTPFAENDVMGLNKKTAKDGPPGCMLG